MPHSPHTVALAYLDAHANATSEIDVNLTVCALLCALHAATASGAPTVNGDAAGEVRMVASVTCHAGGPVLNAAGRPLAAHITRIASASPWYIVVTRLEAAAAAVLVDWETDTRAPAMLPLAQACIGLHAYLVAHVGAQRATLVRDTECTWAMLDAHITRLRGVALWLATIHATETASTQTLLAVQRVHVAAAAEASMTPLQLDAQYCLRIDARQQTARGRFQAAAACYSAMSALTSEERSALRLAPRHGPDAPDASPPPPLPPIRLADARCMLMRRGVDPCCVYDFASATPGTIRPAHAWTTHARA